MSTFEHSIAAILQGTWWVLLLRGLGAIAFGIVMYAHPVIAIPTLVLLFAIYMAADGILGVWTAFSGRKEHEDWLILLLGGLLGIGIGIMTFAVPALTATALLFFVAIWAVATGAFHVLAGLRVRKVIICGNILVVIGALTILFGGFLMANPATGMRAVLWIIATYLVVAGAFLTLFSFRARLFEKMIAKAEQ